MNLATLAWDGRKISTRRGCLRRDNNSTILACLCILSLRSWHLATIGAKSLRANSSESKQVLSNKNNLAKSQNNVGLRAKLRALWSRYSRVFHQPIHRFNASFSSPKTPSLESRRTSATRDSMVCAEKSLWRRLSISAAYEQPGSLELWLALAMSASRPTWN